MFDSTVPATLNEVEKPKNAPDGIADPVKPAAAQGESAEQVNDLSTKSGAKKEAKRLAQEAKKAASAAKKAAEDALKAASGAAPKREKKVKVVEVEEEFVNTTPKGEKKDVSGNMPKSAYNPIAVEAAWYEWWEEKGFFQPRYKEGTEQLLPDGRNYTGEVRDEGVFVIPAPPPNVTGSLHTGHALAAALQDTMSRWNRMKGKTVLWVPGFDHAGISTQAVVENRLIKLEGKSRHDYGREKFLEKVWEWKDEYQQKIMTQTKRMGSSSDWNRVAFTMDDNLSRAVREAFVTLHKKGMLYRANRLVNWCCKLTTTLSNLEVDQKELTGRTMLSVPGYDPKEKFEFGAITSFAYEIEDSDERIIVATTRPETMLGDTAIAVHPDDPRYTHLHGKFAKHPFVNRRIPIVCDPITVDMAFGTGAVKITPAHDANDYECGKRHNLEFINLLNDDGTYNENAGPYAGMKRFHVRNAVLKDLEKAGLYIETKDNPMQVPICSKSGDIIEAYLKPQWWVDFKQVAQEAAERTRAGELLIQPKTSEAEWYRWLDNMQDWCISRQLWWGHRCPAWLITYEGAVSDPADDANWAVGRDEEEAREEAEKRANGRKYTLSQDEDVLDTWFSSGLWPFSILGWPNKTPDLEKFYPASVLETGWDILFFWVARMVLMGLTLTGQMPFKEVYCHGLIRDAEGRKMSKSLGNVIDPVDVIQGTPLESLHAQLRMGNLADKEIQRAEEGQKKLFPKGIPQCGTDALRFALCNYTTGGQDINLKINDIEGYRKFCNKLWNATKFCMVKLGMIDIDGQRLEGTFVPNKTGAKTGKESLAERWVLHKLNQATIKINKDLEARRFYPASEQMYSFWLYELCDVFIEATKPLTADDTPAEVKNSALNTIYTCLESGLRLIHPVMPYVSEDLWQRLPRREGESYESIMICPYPQEIAEYNDPQAEKDFDLVDNSIRVARSIFAGYSLPVNGKTPEEKHEIFVQADDATTAAMFQSQVIVMESLIKGCRTVNIVSSGSQVPEGCGSELVAPGVTIHIPVKGKIDAKSEIEKSQKKMTVTQQHKDRAVKSMSIPNYETKIPAEVQRRDQEKLKEIDAELETLRKQIEKFELLA